MLKNGNLKNGRFSGKVEKNGPYLQDGPAISNQIAGKPVRISCHLITYGTKSLPCKPNTIQGNTCQSGSNPNGTELCCSRVNVGYRATSMLTGRTILGQYYSTKSSEGAQNNWSL